jgi:hypothetical protein
MPPTSSNRAAATPLRVVPVDGRRDVTRFLRVPHRVYAGDPFWIPPLELEQRQMMSPRSAYFEHARARFWTALRGDQPVGRISAQVDDLRIRQYDDATGHFGMLEAIDDQDVFAALLATAGDWLREQGMRRALGPFNLSINGDIGTLVEGFDSPPMILMGHARPYYDARIKACGYAKAKDVVAMILDTTGQPPRFMDQIMRRARESAHLQFQPIRKKHLRQDMAAIGAIFNDAWSDNWSFVPFTDAELEELAQVLRHFVPAGLVQTAFVDGEPAAFIVIIPNLNEIITDLNGRLLPFGWAKMLWRIKVRGTRSGRVALMGVRKKFQNSAIAMGLVFGLFDAVKDTVLGNHIEKLELSWVLEDNEPMLHIERRLGGVPYKTYRVYEKPL